jgi:hypothetical protein
MKGDRMADDKVSYKLTKLGKDISMVEIRQP